MGRPRVTITDVLFDICVTEWKKAGGRIKKELRPPVGNDDLASMLWDPTQPHVPPLCILYPHDPTKHASVEQTFLHELIHFGMKLLSMWDCRCAGVVWKDEKKKRGATYWLEKYMWKRLTQQQKAILGDLLENLG